MTFLERVETENEIETILDRIGVHDFMDHLVSIATGKSEHVLQYEGGEGLSADWNEIASVLANLTLPDPYQL